MVKSNEQAKQLIKMYLDYINEGGWYGVGDGTPMKEIRSADNISVEKSEGNTPHERRSLKWDHNIKINFKEIGCMDVVWIKLA
jgi:hypothetical protein